MENEQTTVIPAHREVTGMELYDLFRMNMLERGVGMDQWVDMDRTDRQAWDTLASQILLKEYLA